ncbi:hypothetical protein NQ314_018691 [Rhamnusium bicolor]|uniref:PiggyBac transposable element-derived protein domain-containing protein n=1 Tax=Rhamnusium bicolor TaxID=1586634 RepID=A0AAV8WQF7_9CUCU|nr:hypothetical protein NQ314_018691 [Rhamnusium bicolor]
MMSMVHLPSVRSYWAKSIGMTSIKEVMPQKHFEKIRNLLHFNDNTHMTTRNDPNHDRLYKLRPIINYLLERFHTVPYERDLSVDEQICSTKSRSFLKQYIPAKPHNWGYKFFVMSGVSGYTYNFDFTQVRRILMKTGQTCNQILGPVLMLQ